MKKGFYIAISSFFILLSTACDNTIIGNNNYQNQVIEQGASAQYNTIAVYDNIEVRVTSGANAISVYAPSNVLPHISTTVVDDVLVVKYADGVKVLVEEEPVVFVALPGLTGVQANDNAESGVHNPIQTLRVEGDGEIEVANLNVPHLTVSVIGSGNISIRGTAQEAVYKVDGRGEINADRMNVGSLNARVDGNGEIECYATERLEAHTTGMGEIKYQGPAGLQVVSSGRVIRDID